MVIPKERLFYLDMGVYTKTAKYYFIEDKIFVSEVLPDSEIVLEDVEINNQKRTEVLNGLKYPILIDIRKIKSITREARLLARNDACTGQYIAAAILVEGTISRLIGNISIGWNLPEIPMKVFLDKKEALEWLENYVSKE
ncbi:MAG: hypothetical protein GY827_07545 [Cytophagales bacterium]|nr:hypothetical protein [Cytophagales bacterium]